MPHLTGLNIIPSAAWPQLEPGSGQETLDRLAELYSRLELESTSLGHIIVDTVTVVNHLGMKLPVPLIFCSSWEVRIPDVMDESRDTDDLHRRIFTL